MREARSFPDICEDIKKIFVKIFVNILRIYLCRYQEYICEDICEDIKKLGRGEERDVECFPIFVPSPPFHSRTIHLEHRLHKETIL